MVARSPSPAAAPASRYGRALRPTAPAGAPLGDESDPPPPGPGTASGLDPAALLPDESLPGLLASLDPTARLAPDAAAALARLAVDFVADALAGGAAAARGRRADAVVPADVAAHADAAWGLRVPGHGPDAVRAYRRRPPSAVHAARAAAVAEADGGGG
jgi:hypothetical protein